MKSRLNKNYFVFLLNEANIVEQQCGENEYKFQIKVDSNLLDITYFPKRDFLEAISDSGKAQYLHASKSKNKDLLIIFHQLKKMALLKKAHGFDFQFGSIIKLNQNSGDQLVTLKERKNRLTKVICLLESKNLNENKTFKSQYEDFTNTSIIYNQSYEVWQEMISYSKKIFEKRKQILEQNFDSEETNQNQFLIEIIKEYLNQNYLENVLDQQQKIKSEGKYNLTFNQINDMYLLLGQKSKIEKELNEVKEVEEEIQKIKKEIAKLRKNATQFFQLTEKQEEYYEILISQAEKRMNQEYTQGMKQINEEVKDTEYRLNICNNNFEIQKEIKDEQRITELIINEQVELYRMEDNIYKYKLKKDSLIKKLLTETQKLDILEEKVKLVEDCVNKVNDSLINEQNSQNQNIKEMNTFNSEIQKYESELKGKYKQYQELLFQVDKLNELIHQTKKEKDGVKDKKLNEFKDSIRKTVNVSQDKGYNQFGHHHQKCSPDGCYYTHYVDQIFNYCLQFDRIVDQDDIDKKFYMAIHSLVGDKKHREDLVQIPKLIGTRRQEVDKEIEEEEEKLQIYINNLDSQKNIKTNEISSLISEIKKLENDYNSNKINLIINNIKQKKCEITILEKQKDQINLYKDKQKDYISEMKNEIEDTKNDFREELQCIKGRFDDLNEKKKEIKLEAEYVQRQIEFQTRKRYSFFQAIVSSLVNKEAQQSYSNAIKEHIKIIQEKQKKNEDRMQQLDQKEKIDMMDQKNQINRVYNSYNQSRIKELSFEICKFDQQEIMTEYIERIILVQSQIEQTVKTEKDISSLLEKKKLEMIQRFVFENINPKPINVFKKEFEEDLLQSQSFFKNRNHDKCYELDVRCDFNGMVNFCIKQLIENKINNSQLEEIIIKQEGQFTHEVEFHKNEFQKQFQIINQGKSYYEQSIQNIEIKYFKEQKENFQNKLKELLKQMQKFKKYSKFIRIKNENDKEQIDKLFSQGYDLITLDEDNQLNILLYNKLQKQQKYDEEQFQKEIYLDENQKETLMEIFQSFKNIDLEMELSLSGFDYISDDFTDIPEVQKFINNQRDGRFMKRQVLQKLQNFLGKEQIQQAISILRLEAERFIKIFEQIKIDQQIKNLQEQNKYMEGQKRDLEEFQKQIEKNDKIQKKQQQFKEIAEEMKNIYEIEKKRIIEQIKSEQLQIVEIQNNFKKKNNKFEFSEKEYTQQIYEKYQNIFGIFEGKGIVCSNNQSCQFKIEIQQFIRFILQKIQNNEIKVSYPFIPSQKEVTSMSLQNQNQCNKHKQQFQQIPYLTVEYVALKKKEKQQEFFDMELSDLQKIVRLKANIEQSKVFILEQIQEKLDLINQYFEFSKNRNNNKNENNQNNFRELIQKEQENQWNLYERECTQILQFYKQSNFQNIPYFKSFFEKQLFEYFGENSQNLPLDQNKFQSFQDKSQNKRRKYCCIDFLKKLEWDIQENNQKEITILDDYKNWKDKQVNLEKQINQEEEHKKSLEKLLEKRKILMLKDYSEIQLEHEEIILSIDYLENKEQISQLKRRNENLKNITFSRQNYFSLILDNNEIISVRILSNDESEKLNEIREIIQTENKINYFNNYLLKKKILLDQTFNQIELDKNSVLLDNLSEYQRYFFINGFLMCSINKWNDGKILTKDEQLVACLISIMFEEYNWYQKGQQSQILLQNEHRTKKILYKLKDSEKSLGDIVEQINKEYKENKLKISQVKILSPKIKNPKPYISKNLDQQSSQLKQHLKRQELDLNILELEDQYMILVKVNCMRDMSGDSQINIQLEKNYILNQIINETDLMENLFSIRLQKIYNQILRDSPKLGEVYASEKFSLQTQNKFSDLITGLFQVFYIQEDIEKQEIDNKTQTICLFAYISWLENVIEYQRSKKLGDPEEKEIVNIIKRTYIQTVFNVIDKEQKRRKKENEMNQEKSKEEKYIERIIEEDEEEFLQISQEIQEKQDQIDQSNKKIERLLEQIDEAENTYSHQISGLQNILDDTTQRIQEATDMLNDIIKQDNKDEQELKNQQDLIKQLEQQKDDVQNKIEQNERELQNMQQEMIKLQRRKIEQENNQKRVAKEKEKNEKEKLKKEKDIQLGQFIKQFLHNLSTLMQSPSAIELFNEMKQVFQFILNLSKMLKQLEEILKKKEDQNNKSLWGILMKDIDYDHFEQLLNSDDNEILGEPKDNIIKRIQGVFFNSQRSEFQFIQELHDGRVVKIFKIKSCNLTNHKLLQVLFDSTSQQIRDQYIGLSFPQGLSGTLEAKNYQSLGDFDQRIQPFLQRRMELKCSYKDVLNYKKDSYYKVEQIFKDLNIQFGDIQHLFIDEIQIICTGNLVIENDLNLSGVDLSGIVKGISAKNKEVFINTSGKDGVKYRENHNEQALSGQYKRVNSISKGDSGYDGFHGGDGFNAGHIKIKIEEGIENENYLAFKSDGGDGQEGQLGGDGDEGEKGEDGEDGQANDTHGFGGGQTNFGFGKPGKKGKRGGAPGLTGLPGRGGKCGVIEITKREEKILKQSSNGKDALNILAKKAPSGGLGGKGGIQGMDEVIDKEGFFYKSKKYKKLVDREHLYENYPKLRQQILAGSSLENNFGKGIKGNEGLFITATVMNPLVGLAVCLFANFRVNYQEPKNIFEYRNRNHKALRGENNQDIAKLRKEDREPIQKLSSCGFEKLNAEMNYKKNEDKDIQGIEEHKNHLINLNYDKEQIQIDINLCENEQNDIQSDLNSISNEIQKKDQQINQIKVNINQFKNQIQQIDVDKNEKINQAVRMMKNLQRQRDQKGKQNLKVDFLVQKLQKYINQQGIFLNNKDGLKQLIEEYLDLIRKGIIDSIKDINLRRVDQKKKRDDLQKMKKNLIMEQEQKQQNIAIEAEIEQEVEEQVQEEQEFELEFQIDYENEIKQQIYNRGQKQKKIYQLPYSTEKQSSSAVYREKQVHEYLQNALRHYRSGFYSEEHIIKLEEEIKQNAAFSNKQLQKELQSFQQKKKEIDISKNVNDLSQIIYSLMYDSLSQLHESISREQLNNVREKIPFIKKILQQIGDEKIIKNLISYSNYQLQSNEFSLMHDIENMLDIFEKRSFIFYEKCAINFNHIKFQDLNPNYLMSAMSLLCNKSKLESNLFIQSEEKENKMVENIDKPKLNHKKSSINKIMVLSNLLENLKYEEFFERIQQDSGQIQMSRENSLNKSKLLQFIQNNQMLSTQDCNNLQKSSNKMIDLNILQSQIKVNEQNSINQEHDKNEIILYLDISKMNFEKVIAQIVRECCKEMIYYLQQYIISSNFQENIKDCIVIKEFEHLKEILISKELNEANEIAEVVLINYEKIQQIYKNKNSLKEKTQIVEQITKLKLKLVSYLESDEQIFQKIKDELNKLNQNDLEIKIQENLFKINEIENELIYKEQEQKQIIEGNDSKIELEIEKYFNTKVEDLIILKVEDESNFIYNLKKSIVLDLISFYNNKSKIVEIIDKKIKEIYSIQFQEEITKQFILSLKQSSQDNLNINKIEQQIKSDKSNNKIKYIQQILKDESNQIQKIFLNILYKELLSCFQNLEKLKNGNQSNIQQQIIEENKLKDNQNSKENLENQRKQEIDQELSLINQFILNQKPEEIEIYCILKKVKEVIHDHEVFFQKDLERLSIYQEINKHLYLSLQPSYDKKKEFKNNLQQLLRDLPIKNWNKDFPNLEFSFDKVMKKVFEQLEQCTQQNPFQLKLIYYYLKHTIENQQEQLDQIEKQNEQSQKEKNQIQDKLNKVEKIYNQVQNYSKQKIKNEVEGVLHLLIVFADQFYQIEIKIQTQKLLDNYYGQVFLKINNTKSRILDLIIQNFNSIIIERNENQIILVNYILNHLEFLFILQENDIQGENRIKRFSELEKAIEIINKQQQTEQVQKMNEIHQLIQKQIEIIVFSQMKEKQLPSEFINQYQMPNDESLINSFIAQDKTLYVFGLEELFDQFGKLNEKKFQSLINSNYTLVCNIEEEKYFRFFDAQQFLIQNNQERLNSKIGDMLKLSTNLFTSFKITQLTKLISRFNKDKSLNELVQIAFHLTYFVYKEVQNMKDERILDQNLMKLLNNLYQFIKHLIFTFEKDQKILIDLRHSLDLLLNELKMKNENNQYQEDQNTLKLLIEILLIKSWFPTDFTNIDLLQKESFSKQYIQLNEIQQNCQLYLEEVNEYIQNRQDLIEVQKYNLNLSLKEIFKKDLNIKTIKQQYDDLKVVNQKFLLTDLQVADFEFNNLKEFIDIINGDQKSNYWKKLLNSQSQKNLIIMIKKVIKNQLFNINKASLEELLLQIQQYFRDDYFQFIQDITYLYHQKLLVEIDNINHPKDSQVENVNLLINRQIETFIVYLNFLNNIRGQNYILNIKQLKVKQMQDYLSNLLLNLKSNKYDHQQEEEILSNHIYNFTYDIQNFDQIIQKIQDDVNKNSILIDLLLILPIKESQKNVKSLIKLIKCLSLNNDWDINKYSSIFDIGLEVLINAHYKQLSVNSQDILEEIEQNQLDQIQEECQQTIKILKNNENIDKYIKFIIKILLDIEKYDLRTNFIVDAFIDYCSVQNNNIEQQFECLKKFMDTEEVLHLTKIIQFEQTFDKAKNIGQIYKSNVVEYVEDTSSLTDFYKNLKQSSILQWKEQLINFRYQKQIKQRFNKEEQFENMIDMFFRYCYQNNLIQQGLDILEQIVKNREKYYSLKEVSFSIYLFMNLKDFSAVSQIMSNYEKNIGIEIMMSKINMNLDLKTLNTVKRLKINLINQKFDDIQKFCLIFISQISQLKDINNNKFQSILDLIIDTYLYIDDQLMNKVLDQSLYFEDWEQVLIKEKIRKTMQSDFKIQNSIYIEKIVELIYQIGKKYGIDTQEKLINKIKIYVKQEGNNINELKSLYRLLNQIFYDENFDKQKFNNFSSDLQQWVLQNKNQNQSGVISLDKLKVLMLSDTSINKQQKGVFEIENSKGYIDMLEGIIMKVNNDKKKYEKQFKKESDFQEWAVVFKEKQQQKQPQLVSSIQQLENQQQILRWNISTQNDNICELLSVICSAVHYCDNRYPRDTQLLALLMFLDNREQDKGRLANVSTGEGKTLITVMLSTCMGLIGKRVDVVTSSKVLAIRDSQRRERQSKEGYSQFFDLFNLKVGNNCDSKCENPIEGDTTRKERYENCQIIYGEASYFQRDFLLSNYFDKDIRKGKGDVLILDEVDSMMIDNAARSLYISHVISDFKYLKDLFILIWTCVNNATEYNFTQENVDKIHKFINESIKLGNDRISEDQEYLNNSQIKIIIPNQYDEFVQKNMKTWIESAYRAKSIAEDNSYIIGDEQSNKLNEVIIMDKDTGVEQTSSKWSNGLHHFLQLKHSSETSNETLKAIFISNLGYFKMYNNLFGMTGTLGDQQERNLLNEIYNVKFFEIPRFKQYLYQYDFQSESVSSQVEQQLIQILNNIKENFDQGCSYCDQSYLDTMKSKYNQLESLKKNIKDKKDELRDQIDKNLIQINEKEKNLKLFTQLLELPKLLLKSIQMIDFDEFKQNIKNYALQIDDILKSIEEEQEKINIFLVELSEIINCQQQKSIEEQCEKIKIKFEELQVEKFKMELDQNIQILKDQQIKFEDDINLISKEKEKIEEDIQFYKKEKELQIGSKKSDSRRSILIITENIQQLKLIYQKVNEEYNNDESVRIFTYDRAYKKFEISSLKPGDIIIATNIAGRGTDLDVSSQVEDNGGLHVILSYMPKNIRIEKQAFGRTARSGNQGSGTFIVLDSRLENDESITITKLKEERDQEESQRLNDILRIQFPKIIYEDKLFQNFNQLKQRVKDISKDKYNHDSDIQKIHENILKNKWAVWLDFINEDLNKITKQDQSQISIIQNKYKEFEQSIIDICNQKDLMLAQGPGELLLLGTTFMKQNKLGNSITCFDKVVDENYNCSAASQYYKSYCIIKQNKGNQSSKIQSKQLLKHSLKLMNYEKENILTRNQFLNQVNEFAMKKGKSLDSNQYNIQNEGFAQVLEMHINSIHSIIGKSIEKESFRIEGFLKEESDKIFDSLIKERIFKDFRLSKQVQISQDGKRIQIKNKNIQLPKQLLYGEKKLVELIQIQIKQMEDQNKQRQINSSLFEKQKGLIYTKEQFEHDTQDIIVKKMYIEINQDVEDIFIGQQDEKVYSGLGQKIKEFLLRKKQLSPILKDKFLQNLKQIIKSDLNQPKTEIETKQQVDQIMYHLENYEAVLIEIDKIKTIFQVEAKNDEIFFNQKQSIFDFLTGKRKENILDYGYFQIDPEQKSQFCDKSLIIKALKQIIKYKDEIQDKSNFQALLMYSGLYSERKQALKQVEFYMFNNENHLQVLKNYDNELNLKKQASMEDKKQLEQMIKTLELNEINFDDNLSCKIKDILIQNIQKDCVLNKDNFGLSDDEFNNLKVILENRNIIKLSYVNQLCGKEDFEINNELEGKVMLLLEKEGMAKVDDLMFQDQKGQGEIIFGILKSLKVIKEVKVNYQGKNHFSSDKISKILRENFSSMDRIDDKTKAVRRLIKELAGKLKTIESPQAELLDIRSQNTKLPPEYLEFAQIGFDHLISLKKKMNWFGAIMVAVIGFLQIVAGAAMIVLSGGSLTNLGQALISEGIGDILFAAQCMIQGKFSWKMYLKHKLQSLMTTLIFCGVGSVFASGANQAVKAGVASLRAISKAIGKKVAEELISCGTQLLTSQLSEKVINEMMDQLKNLNILEKFSEWAESNNEQKLKQQEFENELKQMYGVLGSEGRNQINDILNSCFQYAQKGSFQSQILSKAQQIVGGLSSHLGKLAQAQKNKKLASITNILNTGLKLISITEIINDLKEVFELSNKIFDELIKELKSKRNEVKKKLENSSNNEEKIKQIAKEKIEISFSQQVFDHSQEVKNQIKHLMQEKVRQAFVSPSVTFLIQKAVQPLQNALNRPFKNSMEQFEYHVKEQVEIYKNQVMQDKSQKHSQDEIKQFSKRQIKALNQSLGIQSYEDLSNLNPSLAQKLVVENFPGLKLDKLRELYGSKLGIYQQDDKFYAILPTYNQFCEHMKDISQANGDIQIKITSEVLKVSINVVEAGSGKVINSSNVLARLAQDGKEPFQIKYVPPDQEGQIGHYVPMIKGEDGKYRDVIIPQNENTKNACFQQAVLFLTQYEKNKNEQSAIQYAQKDDNIKKFTNLISSKAQKNTFSQYYYNQFNPVQDKSFIGGYNQKKKKQHKPIVIQFENYQDGDKLDGNKFKNQIQKARNKILKIRDNQKIETIEVQLKYKYKDKDNKQQNESVVLVLNNRKEGGNELYSINGYIPEQKDEKKNYSEPLFKNFNYPEKLEFYKPLELIQTLKRHIQKKEYKQFTDVSGVFVESLRFFEVQNEYYKFIKYSNAPQQEVSQQLKQDVILNWNKFSKDPLKHKVAIPKKIKNEQ